MVKTFIPALTSFMILSSPVMASEVNYFADATIDISSITGGLESGSATRGLVNLGMSYDTSNLFGKESEFAAGYSLLRGDVGSELSGDIQGFSNIDEDEFNRIFEVTLSVALTERLNIIVGQMDAIAVFAAPEYGGEFLQASMGFSPTIVGTPTYPLPSLGMAVEFSLSKDVMLKVGSFDSSEQHNEFDQQFSVAEVGYQYAEGSSVRVGVWHHTGLETVTGQQSNSDPYLVVDHVLSEKMTSFLQWGIAEPAISEIESHISAGVNYTGIFKEDDSFGFGITRVELTPNNSETSYELFYSHAINDHFMIKPDLQFISSPSGDASLDDAIVFSVRLTASL